MLTEKEVKDRATTPEKALDVSIQHHEENLELSEEEVRAIRDKSDGLLWRTLCGLCMHNNDKCDSCILKTSGNGCKATSSQFRKAKTALDNFIWERASFSDYRVEQFKMVELLKKLKRENYGKSKCKCEKKARHGDYGHVRGTKNHHVYVKSSNGDICLMGNDKIYHECLVKLEHHTIDGNIFADLKRNSEDLRKFSKKTEGSGVLKAQIFSENRIEFSIAAGCDRATASLDQATEIHQKLGQMIATIRRDKNG